MSYELRTVKGEDTINNYGKSNSPSYELRAGKSNYEL